MEHVYLCSHLDDHGFALFHDARDYQHTWTCGRLSAEFVAGYAAGVALSGLRKDAFIYSDIPAQIRELVVERTGSKIRPLTADEFMAILSRAGLEHRRGSSWPTLI